MVRLKVRANAGLAALSEFQFHYGTIKSKGAELAAKIADYFNSTMVRLKDRGADARRMRDGISIPLWYD